MNGIQAEIRDPKAKAKQLRRTGHIPCVIGGGGRESLSIQINGEDAKKLCREKQIGSKALLLVEGKTYHTLIREMERDSLTGALLHISFQVLDENKKANSVADVVLLNKDKVQGILEQMQLQIPHAAEPRYLVDTVTVDLEGLPAGTVITVGDIPAFQSENIELKCDPGNLVLRISDKKRGGFRFGEGKPEAAE